MKKMLKKKNHIAILLLVSIFLSACGGTSGKEDSSYSNRITYTITDKKSSNEDVEETVQRMQKRVEHYFEDALVTNVDDKIIVEINSEKIPSALLKQLGRPAKLEILMQKEYDTLKSGEKYTPSIEGQNISSAKAGTQKNGDTETFGLELSLDEEGTKQLADMTSGDNIGEKMYIVYDGELILSPDIQSQITDGKMILSGLQTFDDADFMAACIESGSLPLSLKFNGIKSN